MYNLSDRQNGFFVDTKIQFMCNFDRCGYEFICEVLYIPDNAYVIPFLFNIYCNDSCYHEYNGYVTNKMVCGPRYRINDKNTYKILDLRR